MKHEELPVDVARCKKWTPYRIVNMVYSLSCYFYFWRPITLKPLKNINKSQLLKYELRYAWRVIWSLRTSLIDIVSVNVRCKLLRYLFVLTTIYQRIRYNCILTSICFFDIFLLQLWPDSERVALSQNWFINSSKSASSPPNKNGWVLLFWYYLLEMFSNAFFSALPYVRLLLYTILYVSFEATVKNSSPVWYVEDSASVNLTCSNGIARINKAFNKAQTFWAIVKCKKSSNRSSAKKLRLPKLRKLIWTS